MVTGSAAAASAAPAVFASPSSGTIQWYLKTPLVIKVGGATVATCAPGANGPAPSAFSNVGSPLQGTVAGWQTANPMNCGTLVFIDPPAVPLKAEKNGASYSLTSTQRMRIDGYSWNPTGPNVAYSVPWTNGTGGGLLGSPTLTFNDTVVAYSDTLQPIKLTGTVFAAGAGQLS
jgi:hypothetical protein